VSNSHQPFNSIIPQEKLVVNSQELERTAGSAGGAPGLAVSEYAERPGTVFPGHAFSDTQTTNLGGVEGSYLDHIANVVTEAKKACPGWFVAGTCEHGHTFAKELYCGREWCPVCGQDGSPVHLRRFARWLPKLYQCSSIGYFVFTIPEASRASWRSKDKLSFLAKRVTSGDKSMKLEGILTSLGFKRGLTRWHFFGDKSTRFNPHLNVIVEAGRISSKTLDKVKLAWASVLGVDMAVVQYSFTRKQAKMVHILKYVTRATFHEVAWDEALADELYNFRNMRSFGHWTDGPVWQITGKAKYEHIELLGKSLCPICLSKITWGRAIPIAWLKYESSKSLDAGYYQLNTS